MTTLPCAVRIPRETRFYDPRPENDKNEVFKAAADASKACDFILDKNRSIEAPAEEGPYTAATTESREASARAL